MENNKMKIIFMGTPKFGAIILKELCNANLKPELVITTPDKPVGRKQLLTPSSVKEVAQKYKISILQPEKIENCKLEIKNYQPELIIVAAYGKILPEEILEIPKYGCLNVHPSLLPKYRGSSPIQSAILKGEKTTGITIMLMDKEMDHGPIISSSKFKIQILNLTYKELHNKLAESAAKLLIKIIPKWIKEEIKSKPQNHSKATYTKILKKQDGKIDWQKPIEYIERQTRALNPWPSTYTIYNGKILKILKIELLKNKLIIKEVQLDGKKPMSFKDFLRGHPDFINNKTICSRILI